MHLEKTTIWGALWFSAALATFGCSTSLDAFHCQKDLDCSTQGLIGFCEEVRHCSYSDDVCGRRFGNAAGPLSNTCVGSDIDAGGDVPDAETDSSDAAIGGPFDCENGPLPAFVIPPLNISGDIWDISMNGSIPFNNGIVAISANDEDSTPVVSGAFTSSFFLQAPVDLLFPRPAKLFLVATHPDRLPSFIFPTSPFHNSNSDIDIHLVDQLVYNGLFALADVPNSPLEGLVLITVVDCHGNPVTGATVSTNSPRGQIRYGNQSGIPFPTNSETGIMGLAYVFDVPRGEMTVSAEFGEVTFRPVDIITISNGLTLVTIAP